MYQQLSLVITSLFLYGYAATHQLPSDHQPQQVHIAFGGHCPVQRGLASITEPWNTISVTWSTSEANHESVVRYGLKDITEKTARGTSKRFVDGGVQKRYQYVHRVTLTELQPATEYVYRCGSDAGWSKDFSFRTANSSELWTPLVAVFGDMGTTNARILPAVTKEVQDKRFDAIIHVGDFAYDMADDNGQVGDEYMRLIEPVAANVPYMVCPGNHEHIYNFSHYRERFTMPGNTESLYYSFNLGQIHFISINTEAYYYLEYGKSVLANQFNWIMKDLKEASKPENREKQPWIIVYGHKPMYCSNYYIDDCSLRTTKIRIGFKTPINYEYGLENLFYEAGVDLLLWGHEHSYERLWPMYDYQVKNGSFMYPYRNPRAPLHITTGTAGSKYNITGFDVIKPPWSAVRLEDYGYSLLQVHNKSHLHFQQISVDKDGEVIDEVWLIKNKHGPYNR